MNEQTCQTLAKRLNRVRSKVSNFPPSEDVASSRSERPNGGGASREADQPPRRYSLATMISSALPAILCISGVLVCSISCAAQAVPPSDQWGDQHNSAGATLTYKETGRMVVNGNTMVIYNFFASGLPTDRQYTLSTKIIGAMPGKISEVHVNNEGKVLSELADPAHNVAEKPAVINLVGSKGEPFQFAIASADGQSRAFTRIIPFPIESSAGPCHCLSSRSFPTTPPSLLQCLDCSLTKLL
jgi:hypothetical protein